MPRPRLQSSRIHRRRSPGAIASGLILKGPVHPSGESDGASDPGALDIRQVSGGSLIRVRLTPKASSNAIAGFVSGALRLRVQAPPVEGAANEKARDFLAKALGVSRGSVALERGSASRDKVFRIDGLGPEEIRGLIFRLLS